jgi:hypothetical protein
VPDLTASLEQSAELIAVPLVLGANQFTNVILNLLYLEATKAPPGVNVKVSNIRLRQSHFTSKVMFLGLSCWSTRQLASECSNYRETYLEPKPALREGDQSTARGKHEGDLKSIDWPLSV